MGKDSKIQWTHHTYNPWRGCTRVSPGCDHCYAETMSARDPAVLGVWGPDGTRPVAAESYWRQPLRWDAAAAEVGERHRVFCASLADVFEGRETMPAVAYPAIFEARLRLFGLIERTPRLDWLLLTKRPENVATLVPVSWLERFDGYPPNVWIGCTVENQEQAEARIPHLLRVPARVRFLSCEPLLGPVDLGIIPDALYEAGMPFSWNRVSDGRGIHWVICGGESGPKARPMHPDWARDLRDQCQAANVPYFFKQWGEWLGGEVYRNGSILGIARHQDGSENCHQGKPDHWWSGGTRGGVLSTRVGVKVAGRLLDGREWNEVPA